MFTTKVEIARRFLVNAGLERVFALLSDVPSSAKHFPGVEALEPLEGDAYRWVMEKIGLSRLSLKTIYACKYKSDAGRQVVQWTPVRGEGNAQVRGWWRLKAVDGERTDVRLYTTVVADVAMPALTKGLMGPLVSREFNKLVDRYVESLTVALEAKEAGRVKTKAKVKSKAKAKAGVRAKSKTKAKPKGD